jgi:hypothetical protein
LTPGRAARLLLLLIAVALTVVALGAPRFTWGNEGVIVDHSRTHGMAALGAALALAATAYATRPRWLAIVAGLAAAVLLGLGASQLAWRIEVVETGFHERSLGRAVHLAWKEIEAVEPREGGITLRARGGTRVVISTRRFAPDERIRLERTIARRVTEAAR